VVNVTIQPDNSQQVKVTL